VTRVYFYHHAVECAENIAKIFLLPKKWLVYWIRNKCMTV